MAAGQLVPVALEGAHLPGGKIKRGKLRGVESQGMICSGPELDVPDGLYPHVGDAGILVFQEEYKPGTDVKEVFGLGDDIVDYEILANRPDCLSVWGIARESAAVLGEHLSLIHILSHPQKRDHFLWHIEQYLEPSFFHRIIVDGPEDAYPLLKERGAPEDCYILSLYKDMDGTFVPLRQAMTWEGILYADFIS